MASSRRGSYKEQDKSEKCGQCSKIVTDKDKAVLCEICESWFHTTCEGVKDDLYEVMSSFKVLHWFCKRCNGGVFKSLKTIGKMQEKVDEMDGRLVSMHGEMKMLRSELEEVKLNVTKTDLKVEGAIEAKLLDAVEKHSVDFREIMKQQLDEEINMKSDENIKKELNTQMSEELDELHRTITQSKQQADDIRMANAELEDIESRRCNIILYRVPESREILGDSRRQDDRSFCEQFLGRFSVGVVSEDVRKVQRLGVRNTGQDAQPRPILIQLGSRHIKNLIMESLYKISSFEARFKGTIVAHDMTRKQREDCKKMVAEAKEKSENEAGDFIYRVRGPPERFRIVQIRKRN